MGIFHEVGHGFAQSKKRFLYLRQSLLYHLALTQNLEFKTFVEGCTKLRHFDGFGKEIFRSVLSGLYCSRDVIHPGDDYDRCVGMDFFQPRQPLKRITIGQPEIKNYRIKGLRFNYS